MKKFSEVYVPLSELAQRERDKQLQAKISEALNLVLFPVKLACMQQQAKNDQLCDKLAKLVFDNLENFRN